MARLGGHCHAPGIFRFTFPLLFYFLQDFKALQQETRRILCYKITKHEIQSTITRLQKDYSLLPSQSQTSLLSSPIGPSSSTNHSTSPLERRAPSLLSNSSCKRQFSSNNLLARTTRTGTMGRGVTAYRTTTGIGMVGLRPTQSTDSPLTMHRDESIDTGSV